MTIENGNILGESILTQAGVQAYIEASLSPGKKIVPVEFRFTDLEISRKSTHTSMSGWHTAAITSYTVIDDDTVEYLCDVPPDKATSYCRTAGLFLEDGTLMQLAWPPYPFPPNMHQRFKIQTSYSNASGLTEFKYTDSTETEQDLARLETQAILSEQILKNSMEIGLIKQFINN